MGTERRRFTLVLRPAERLSAPSLPFALGCDEDAPTLAEHWHDETGHAFPCSREDLVALREQIDDALGPVYRR